MKILVDTCVILDGLQKREPFWKGAEELFLLAALGKIDGRITAKSVTDIYYHMRKLIRNKEKAKEQLYALLELFQIEDTLAEDCRNAMIGDYTDFEDGVLIETAKRTIKAKNLLKIKDIIDIIYEYVETNLSIATIKDYVPYAINIDINTIQSVVLPGGSYGPTTTPAYPLWFFIADKKETAELIEELYGTEEEETVTDELTTNTESTNENTGVEVNKKEASDIKIELLNGTGSDKTLTQVKKLLESKGYEVTGQNTTSTSKTTIINKTDVDTKFTDNIKYILGVGNISTGPVTSSKIDITIIIGKDYIK